MNEIFIIWWSLILYQWLVIGFGLFYEKKSPGKNIFLKESTLSHQRRMLVGPMQKHHEKDTLQMTTTTWRSPTPCSCSPFIFWFTRGSICMCIYILYIYYSFQYDNSKGAFSYIFCIIFFLIYKVQLITSQNN
jgi:hypothetical protein